MQTSASVPPDVFIMEHQPVITLRDLLHETGLGIKLRFLLALTLLALLPALLLVLFLGDPTGREQQETLGQSLFLQAQAQASALDSSFSLRQSTVAAVAANPSLTFLGETSINQSPFSEQGVPPSASTAPSQASALELLHTQQSADPASLAWLLIGSDGVIVATGNGHDHLGTPLAQTHLVSNPSLLLHLVQTAAQGGASYTPILAFDTHTQSAWLAFAVPLAVTSSPHPVLLTLYSLPKLLTGLVTTSQTMSGSVALLLDEKGHLVASAGTLVPGQQTDLVPKALQTLRLDTAVPTIIEANPLTGRTDLAIGALVTRLRGRYLLLVPSNTTLVPSQRYAFAGRNTPLLLLFILVAVVLVATWVALPIVRPIRRATRRINATTQEVQRLSTQAQRIAHDHRLGTTIIGGTSRRLATRRQSLLRDCGLIQQTCEALEPRVAFLLKMAQGNSNRPVLDVLHPLQQGIAQIKAVAGSIAGGFEQDQSLGQLNTAMESANEISQQFEVAGQQLEREAQQLALATRNLV